MDPNNPSPQVPQNPAPRPTPSFRPAAPQQRTDFSRGFQAPGMRPGYVPPAQNQEPTPAPAPQTVFTPQPQPVQPQPIQPQTFTPQAPQAAPTPQPVQPQPVVQPDQSFQQPAPAPQPQPFQQPSPQPTTFTPQPQPTAPSPVFGVPAARPVATESGTKPTIKKRKSLKLAVVGVGVLVGIGALLYVALPHSLLAQDKPSGGGSGIFNMQDMGLSVEVPGHLQGLGFATTFLDPKGVIGPDADKIGAFQGAEVLKSAGDPCTVNIEKAPLGVIYKIKGRYDDPAAKAKSKGELVKQFEEFFVTYDEHAESACAEKTELNKRAQDLKPQIKEILDTISD